jgi:Uma2 family endonuclease
MAEAAIKFISEHEYLLFEREALDRHEYYKGEIFAMSGASYKHNVIEDNLRGILHGYLKGKKCRSFGSNLRVHVPKNTLYTYPDILVVCNDPKFVDNEFDTLLNPSVIIEILSPSTANYDRGAKFNLYREIETLNEYLLIDSTNTHVVSYLKNPDLTWTLFEYKDLSDILKINTIDLQIVVADVYAGV